MKEILQRILGNHWTTFCGLPLVLTSMGKVIELLASDAPWYAIVQSEEVTKLLGGIGLLMAKDATVGSKPPTVPPVT